MPFQPATGVGQFTVKGTWNGVIDLATVFHIQKTSDPTAWTSVQLSLGMQRLEAALPLLAAQLPNDVGWTSISFRDLTTEEGAVGERSIAVSGVSAATPVGALVGPIIRWKTGLAGRSNGRTFLPGIAEGNLNDNGQVDSTFAAATNTAANAFRAFIAAATDGTHVGVPLTLVVLSAVAPPGELERVARVVVSNQVPLRPGVQRRRQIGA